MSVLVPAFSADPAENWDDDFEFHRLSRSDSHTVPRAATPLSRDKKNTLRHWTEPGPSTPKRSIDQPENWDDDFRDSTDSPARRRSRTREPENWDDDFEERREGASPKGKSPRRSAGAASASWGSSDDDEEDDYGFADHEEDRTVTSRSRAIPIGFVSETAIPPVPPLPSSLPRSPAASVFSMPSSFGGRDSAAAYSSTAHLALRPTVSGGSSALALLPPSPPIHRERRRLRKKSRPPPATVGNIYEMEDRAEPPARLSPSRSVSPEQPGDASAPPSSEDAHSDSPVAAPIASPSSKTPLLSRIGSVGKKWGAGRKKRASTGPADISLPESHDEPPEPQPSRPPSALMSSPPSTSKHSSWFFRSAGGPGPGPGSPPGGTDAALKHESSVERLMAVVRSTTPLPTPATPPRPGKLRHRAKKDNASVAAPTQADAADLSSSALFLGAPRRPISMQVSASSSGSSWGTSAPRHASYGYKSAQSAQQSRSSSKQRSASASVEDVNKANRSVTIQDVPKREGEGGPGHEKGSRRFMGGIRRISLVGSGKHKRTKSSAPADGRKRPGTASSVPDSPCDDQNQSTPRPPSRVVRSSQDGLLPPIELQPPSPLRISAAVGAPVSQSRHPTLEPSRSHPTLSSRSKGRASPAPINVTPPRSPISSPLPSPTRPKISASPQAASLGRATQPLKVQEGVSSVAVPRRNSLGDLKIPARISQAQVGLKRDLGMVRDFATSVEQLKKLQITYHELVSEVQAVINSTQPPPSRAISPNLFSIPKPAAARARSNTNPVAPLSHRELTTSFHHIEAKYQLSWECAELLIDLGGGGAPPSEHPTSPSPSSVTPDSAAPSTSIDGRKSRERAITLAGDEPKPIVAAASSALGSPPIASPPNTYWRASTGRHDLSQRQLMLLRDMLNNPDSSATFALTEAGIPEEDHSINRNWRWGDAMSSTVTLPSEDSTQMGSNYVSGSKKRRGSRMGMKGLRDMLKSLKKSYSDGPPPQLPPLPIPQSSTSVSASTDSSLNLPVERPHSVVQRRRAKTSTGPESTKSVREKEREKQANSPYGTSVSLTHRASPRRPSLASIFRLGQKHKSTTFVADASADELKVEGLVFGSSGRTSRTGVAEEEEDWDRIDSITDLDQAARALGLSPDGSSTVRGKKGKSPYLLHQQQQQQQHPHTPRRSPNASQSSLWSTEPSPRKATGGSLASGNLLNSHSTKVAHLRQLAEADANRQARPPSRGQQQDRVLTPSPSPQRPVPPRRLVGPSGSVRSAPPQSHSGHSPNLAPGPLPDPKLAMTPENIQPLLENAREVHLRCNECIAELRALLPVPPAALP